MEAAGSGEAGGVLRHLLLKLRATGPVTVAEYMREALTNPGQVRRGRAGVELSAAALWCSSPPPAGLLHAAGRRRRGLHHLAGDQPDIWRGDAQPSRTAQRGLGFFSFLSSRWKAFAERFGAATSSTVLSFGPRATKSTLRSWSASREGQRRCEGSGAQALGGTAERTGVVQSGDSGETLLLCTAT